MGICQTLASGSNHSTLRRAHDAPTPKDAYAQIGCLANSSCLHATVGPLTTKATLASFFHSAESVRLLFFIILVWFC